MSKSNGKLGPTHCNVTNADSMQYWYATSSKTNWNGDYHNRSDNIPLLAYYSCKALRRHKRCVFKLLLSCRLQTTQCTPNAAQTCVKVEHCEHVRYLLRSRVVYVCQNATAWKRWRFLFVFFREVDTYS